MAQSLTPRFGEPGFDPADHEKRWGCLPISMIIIEYFGDGDPAFGGSADDRPVLTTGKVADRLAQREAPIAQFKTVAEAHDFALLVPNRRPSSILGVAPTWR